MKLSTSVMILFAVAGTAIAAPVLPAGSGVPTPTDPANPASSAPSPPSTGLDTASPQPHGTPHKHHKHHKHHQHQHRNVTAYQEASEIYTGLGVIERMLEHVFLEVNLDAKSAGHLKGLLKGTAPGPTTAHSDSTNPLTPKTADGKMVKIKGPAEPLRKTSAVDSATTHATEVRESKHLENSMKHLKKKLRKVMHAVKLEKKKAKHLKKRLRHKKHANTPVTGSDAKHLPTGGNPSTTASTDSKARKNSIVGPDTPGSQLPAVAPRGN